MNRTTDVLFDEHRLILDVLAALEAMAELAARSGTLETDDARDAVRFLRDYADRLHHGKEEAELFPAMLAAGFPSEGGPVAVMLHEHDQGRACVAAMDDAVASALDGAADAGPLFARPALAMVGLLRGHIEKEDHCLFPMAEDALDDDTRARLASRFTAFDADEANRRVAEECRRIAERLRERYAATASPSLARHGAAVGARAR